jgi:hypothetical protein
MQDTTRHTAAVFGELTEDNFVSNLPTQPRPGTKQNCRIDRSIGGGAVNVGCRLKELGWDVQGVLMTGPLTDIEMSRQMEQQIPNVYQLPVLERSRRSVLLPDGTCLTERSPATIQELPANYAHIFQSCPWTVVAPTLAANNAIVASVLDHANHSVLQLSSDQLLDRECLDLMRRASLVVLNQEEQKVVTHSQAGLLQRLK